MSFPSIPSRINRPAWCTSVVLADLIMNTFCSVVGLTTVRPTFYQQLDKSDNAFVDWNNHAHESGILK